MECLFVHGCVLIRQRLFRHTLTSSRLYTFWVGIREAAGLPGLRIHDCRHTWASLGVMNGVGLTTVGRLLGHRQRETTAIYAHLDDGTLRDAAAQAAAVIARAMRFRPVAFLTPEASSENRSVRQTDGGDAESRRTEPTDPLDPNEPGLGSRSHDWMVAQASVKAPAQRPITDWLAEDKFAARSGATGDDVVNAPSRTRDVDWLGQDPAPPTSVTAARKPRKRRRTDFYRAVSCRLPDVRIHDCPLSGASQSGHDERG